VSPAKKHVINLKQSVRHGGQITQLPITQPMFYNRKGFDTYMFWGVIWVTPMLLYTWYHAIRYGDAKISPTPEEYQPKEWEYEKNMITRKLVKSWNWSEQARYEGLLTVLVERQMMHQQNELVAEVKRIMLKHQDYKGYSYRPWDAHRIRMKKYFWENYWVKEGQGQNLELPPPVDAYNEK